MARPYLVLLAFAATLALAAGCGRKSPDQRPAPGGGSPSGGSAQGQGGDPSRPGGGTPGSDEPAGPGYRIRLVQVDERQGEEIGEAGRIAVTPGQRLVFRAEVFQLSGTQSQVNLKAEDFIWSLGGGVTGFCSPVEPGPCRFTPVGVLFRVPRSARPGATLILSARPRQEDLRAPDGSALVARALMVVSRARPGAPDSPPADDPSGVPSDSPGAGGDHPGGWQRPSGSGSGGQGPSPSAAPTALDCDVVVTDASLGGVAAALQSARLGARTCLFAATDWLGGQLTVQGVSAIDEPSQFSKGNEEFIRQRLTKAAGPAPADGRILVTRGPKAERYSRLPHQDETTRTLRPVIEGVRRRGGFAKCWVARYCFAPRDGDAALKELVLPYVRSGKLAIYYESVPKRVALAPGGRIASVDFVQRRFTGQGARPYSVRLSTELGDWYDERASVRYAKRTLRARARVFVDGTETGEVIALAGARHQLGFVQGETREPECVMGFNYPAILEPVQSKALQPGEVPPVEGREMLVSALGARSGLSFDKTFVAPTYYGRERQFKFWGDDKGRAGPAIFDYRRISDKPLLSLLNWEGGQDYVARNLIVPEESLGAQLADWRGGIRLDVLAEAEEHTMSYVAFLNLRPEVRYSGRGVRLVREQGSAKDLFGTGTGLAKFPYLRETRRMEGYRGYYVPVSDIAGGDGTLGAFPGPQYTNYADSVGIGAYGLDYRKCPTGRRIGGSGPRSSRHYQIPLRALVSANVPNLLAANKTLAVSQEANAAFRLHPTEWNAGYGAGTAAAVAIRRGVDAHGLMERPGLVREVQREIVRTGGRVLWFSDGLPPASAR